MGDDYYNSTGESGFDDMFNDGAAFSNLSRTTGQTHPLQPQGATSMRRHTEYPIQGMNEGTVNDQAMRWIPKPNQAPAGMGFNAQRMYANGGHHSS